MCIKFLAKASAAIVIFVSSSALSADYIAPPKNMDWSGFYAGIFAGHSSGTIDGITVLGVYPTTADMSGSEFGLTSGVNYQMDQIVVGAEWDIAWSGTSGSIVCGCGGQIGVNDLNWTSTLRARAGVASNELFIFGTAGIAITNITSTTSPAFVGTIGTDTQTFVGWTAGLGAELPIDESFRLKIDYLYTDLGSQTSPAGTVGILANTSSPTMHTIRVGLNRSF